MIYSLIFNVLQQNLQHPWLVIEDAHVNLTGVLGYLEKFTEPGDYICVEDTNPLTPYISNQGLVKNLGYDESGPNKLNELRKFLTGRADRYSEIRNTPISTGKINILCFDQLSLI